MKRTIFLTLLHMSAYLFAPMGADAGEMSWSLCEAPDYTGFLVDAPQTESPIVELDADEGQFNDREGEGVFKGDVDLRYGTQRLKTDELQYFKDEDRFIAIGSVDYTDAAQGLAVEGGEAELHKKTEYVEVRDAEYRYIPRHARGKAKRIFRKSKDVVQLRKASYTTCNPGNNAWEISGREVILNRESGRGQAKHVVFRVKDVPVAYSPWVTFPIDDRRKTGFLSPAFGTTNNSGTEIITPFYWNMAPNYDMTITPRYLSDRGLQLKSNFRYLFPEDTRGNLRLEYLSDDEIDQNRWLIEFQDKTRLTPHWRTHVVYRDVSDAQYFEDLGSSIGQTSQTHLLQQADFNYAKGPWKLLTRVQNFKTIDDTILRQNRPFKRLPQILAQFRTQDRALGLGYSFRGEWVRFDRDAGLTGNRLDALVGIDWPLVRPGYFVIPKAQLRFTGYSLSDQGPDFSSSPTRTIPTLSFDSGLIFERPVGDGSTVQTIEPRLYYLYTPHEDQDNIPTFDTSEFEFTFAQLFRDNRFTGADRIADANQLTTALTSRWIDTTTGSQLFSASVGQIFYFRDLKVTLPGQERDNDSSSEIVGDVSANVGDRWLATGTTRWDPHSKTHERSALRLRYKGDHNRIVNLGYSYRRKDFDQTDVSLAWPLTPNWHVVGRWNYDIRNSRHVELLGGIEYETCCWAVRLAGRRWLASTDEEFNTSVLFQVVFKGLTKVGSNIGSLLERSIIGYEDEL